MVTRLIPSCQETDAPGVKTILGRSYDRKTRLKNDPQNADRAVITICNMAFDSPAVLGFPTSLSDPLVINQPNGLAGNDIDSFFGMISNTILHELAHVVSITNRKMEVLDMPDGDTAYGWNNVFANTADIAIKNADNYVYLGIWAGLADMGYTLTRIESGFEPDVIQALEAITEAGRLYKYSDITRRALMKVARRFIA
jgi:hypothetical protein